MATEVTVPTLGESITEATLGEWLKQPGDPVQADEPIASLETDKVSVEVPSPVAGVMGSHAVQVGDTVQVGAMIATVEAGGAAPAPAPAASAPAANAGQQAPAAPAGDTPPRSAPRSAAPFSNTASIPRLFRAPARTAASPRKTSPPPPSKRRRQSRRRTGALLPPAVRTLCPPPSLRLGARNASA